jgi:hypothetical protein
VVERVYVGIDVAIAKRKRLPISICHWVDGKCVPLPLRRLGTQPPAGRGYAAVLDKNAIGEFVDETAFYLEKVCERLGVYIHRIGIDAPSAPRPPLISRREAECAMDREGISCFATPSGEDFVGILEKVRRHLSTGGAESRIPHANQLWMLVGFQLFERLAQIAPCLEVYPRPRFVHWE